MESKGKEIAGGGEEEGETGGGFGGGSVGEKVDRIGRRRQSSGDRGSHDLSCVDLSCPVFFGR